VDFGEASEHRALRTAVADIARVVSVPRAVAEEVSGA
jgi:hypothetical protein